MSSNPILLNRWFESLPADRKLAITGSPDRTHNARWWNHLTLDERQKVFDKHKRPSIDLISAVPLIASNNETKIAPYHKEQKRSKKETAE